MSRILLGVSAGIAFYKALDLASKLTQRGDEVRAVLTPHTLKFVTPLSFRAITRQPVYTDTFEDDPEYRPEHISLGEWPDLVVVAPATADLVGRVAAGLGDNLLMATLLATDRPVLLAPAMNDRMWANPIVQRNLSTLREFGYRVLDPGVGHLACGSVGPGRLPDPPDLISEIDSILSTPSA
jgi:phosphopantothenoylcysteine decarboxylase/phosphopantothenate--cysteine ligase